MITIPPLMIIAVLLAFIIVGLRSVARSPNEYYRFDGKMDSFSFFAVVAGSSISLGGAILAFLGLGFSLPWVAILATTTWLLGFIVHYLFIKKVDFEQAKEHKTLHQLIGKSHDSHVPTMIAACASSIGFAGAYGVEMVAITKISSPLFEANHLSNLLFIITLSVVLALYMHRGGLLAVVSTDKLQLLLFSAGILIVTCFVYPKLAGGKLPTFEGLTPSSTSFPAILCLGIVAVNLPWQLVDMSQWQRSFSCDSIGTVKKGLLASALGIGISWLLLIALGLLLRTVGDASQDPVTLLLSYFRGHEVIYALFVMAALGALFSTADSYVIAAAQCIHIDIIHQSQEQPIQTTNKDLDTARKLMWWIAIIPPVVIYVFNIFIPSILDMFFIVFSAQLSIFPSIAFAFSKKLRGPASASILSQAGGLMCAAIFLILCIQGKQGLFFVAPVATLIVSTGLYLLVTLISRKGEGHV